MTRKRISQDDNTYSPRMTKRNGQDSPQDDRKYGRESISPRDDHSAGLSPTKIIIFVGPDMPAPLRRGEPRPRRYIAKFLSIGGVVADRGGKRLGDCDRDPEFFILSLRHVLEIQSFCKFAHNLNRYATVYHL